MAGAGRSGVGASDANSASRATNTTTSAYRVGAHVGQRAENPVVAHGPIVAGENARLEGRTAHRRVADFVRADVLVIALSVARAFHRNGGRRGERFQYVGRS